MGREAEEIIRSKDQSMGSNYKAYVSILHEFIKVIYIYIYIIFIGLG